MGCPSGRRFLIFALRYLKTHSPLIVIGPEVYCICCICLLLLPLKLLLVWSASVLVHELSHILSIKLARGRIDRICIGLNGIKIYTDSLSNGMELICAAAGPIGGLILFVILLKKLPILAVFSLFHSLYNLFPLFPLDGGRMAHCVFAMFLKNARLYQVLSRFDFGVAVTLLITTIIFILRFSLGPVPLLVVLAMIINNKKAKCS